MKKRITSVVLALCLLLPMLPTTALAAEIDSGPCGDGGPNVIWSLDRGTGILTISGQGAMRDYEWDDNHWKHENDFYFTSVVIEEGVTRIGNYAFCNRTSLTNVTISDSVESIGDDAFYLCRKLDSVTIPGSVTSIGPGAFADTKISSFQVAEDNSHYVSQDGVLFSKEPKTLVAYPCMKATTYDIPEGVTAIEASAFKGCTDLTSVTIPNGVTSIGDNAFYNCLNLTSVNIPNDVSCIGNNAFEQCQSLTSISIDIPSSMKSIGDSAFRSCFNLTSLNIPYGVESIGYRAFANSGLISLTIPDSVTRIGWWAFSGCGSLTSVEIPNGVTSIEDNVFEDCYSLSSVTIPDSVTSIGAQAFKGCTLLTEVTIPDGVTSIGWQAFYECASLTEVTIPNGVTEIGWDAFFHCENLTRVTIPDSVRTIGQSVFKACDKLRDVYYGGSKTEWDNIYKYDYDWNIDYPNVTVHYSCTVTFDLNYDGATGAPDEQTVYSDNKVEEPDPAPTREDYTFGGWYKDAECTETEKWDFETAVTDNITLYAKWTENTPPVETKYTVTFDANGGTVNPASAQTDDSGKLQIELPVPIYDGYKFIGWFTSLEESAQEVKKDHVFTENTTIHAKWEKEDEPTEPTKYTVTFDSQGGSAVGNKTVTNGETVAKPDDPTRTGYTFGGWYKEADCKNAWDFAADTVTDNITLYAKWTENKPTEPTKYTVTFDLNYTGATGAPDKQTITSGGKAEKPTDPTRTDYTFGGWYKEADCKNTWDFATDTVSANTTLYAKWTENTPPEETKYTVTFDLNYTGATGAPAVQTITSGGKATLPDPAPTREGYKLDGWYKEAACTNAWNFETDTVSADITLYAKWEENNSGTITSPETRYRIYTDYYTTGGRVYTSHSSATEGTRVTIEVSPRSGYELEGLVVFNVTTGRELSLTRRYYDVYTFIMPDSPVGVAVSFFGRDVDDHVSWYAPDIFPVSYNNAGGKTVKWYYSDGQIRHVTDGFISSSTPLTRDMLISILYNMDPNSTGEPLFWATNQKVMPDIYQSGLWGTDKNISREQAAMLLYNYARHMGYDISLRVDLTGCSDYDGMRPIARTAMSWAQATGLFRRNLLNMISPGSTLTCGEANTILSRFASTVARTR